MVTVIGFNIVGCKKTDNECDNVKNNNMELNKEELWKISKGKKEIIVGVIDSGVDISCDVLKNSIINNNKEDNSLYDERLYDYHGTYICTNISQIAPGVSILPVKFMSGTKGTIEDAISAIEYAIERGAVIINCSWNFDKYSEKLYRLIKENSNVLFICAAGNSSINLDKENIYPCNYDLENIITVGAMDEEGYVYGSSGYGKQVDIVALGVDVEVIVPDNAITKVSGTSIATSYVSAAVALMLSLDADLTPYKIKDILKETATPMSTLKGKCDGNGCLNIRKALLKCQ